jgi:hypothetical protein
MSKNVGVLCEKCITKSNIEKYERFVLGFPMQSGELPTLKAGLKRFAMNFTFHLKLLIH